MQSQLAGLRGECARSPADYAAPLVQLWASVASCTWARRVPESACSAPEGSAKVELLACAASYACSVVQGEGVTLHGSSVSCSAELLCVLLSLGVSLRICHMLHVTRPVGDDSKGVRGRPRHTSRLQGPF